MADIEWKKNPPKPNCPICDKKFTPTRGKTYCSERCRKRAENRRLRSTVPDDQKTQNIDKQDQGLAEAVRGSIWVQSNEITYRLTKATGVAIAWAFHIERQKGWFARVVGDDFCFGFATLPRARSAVEAYLLKEPFDKQPGEKSWRGDCMELV